MTTAITLEQAATWAAAQRTGSAGAKAVLQYLAWALFDGRRPISQEIIALNAEVSLRSVGKHLATLESQGLIRRIQRHQRRDIIELRGDWGNAVPAEHPSTRFLGTKDSPEHVLFVWMLTQDPAGVPFRDVVRNGPGLIRSKGAADEAVERLEGLGHAEEVCQRPRRLRLTSSTLENRPIQTSELPF